MQHSSSSNYHNLNNNNDDNDNDDNDNDNDNDNDDNDDDNNDDDDSKQQDNNTNNNKVNTSSEKKSNKRSRIRYNNDANDNSNDDSNDNNNDEIDDDEIEDNNDDDDNNEIDDDEIEDNDDDDDDEIDDDEIEDNDNDYKVKCPRCRVYNTFSTVSKVFVDAECDICKDDKAKVLFPVCNHVCVCENCCDELNENKTSSSFQNGFFPDNDENSEQRSLALMKNVDGKIYVTIPAGMGCSFWYRRTSRYSHLDKLFMHCDDWGQYGPGRKAEHSRFISGYKKIK